MAKVLIDLRMVRGPLHGIARYALELCRHLPRLEPGWQFVGLTGPDALPENLGDLAPRIPLERCTARFLSPLEQPALALSLFAQQPDLFHATSFSVPALWPGNLVATLHDATHLALSEKVSATHRAYYWFVVAPRAKRANALITVSAFSRDEIAKYLGLAPERLQVIANGVDAAFHVSSQSEIEDFRSRRGLPPKYFAAIGSVKPHKNLKVLLPVAESLPAQLVLLAGRGARRSLGFSESVLELAPLPDEDLVRFYAGAQGVLVPSRYEGFGLPALEAMACGAPVVVSNAGALPGIVGEAGLLVPPDDSNKWRAACQKLFRDDALRRKLGELGRERSERYSWPDCAKQTLQVYKRALGLS